MKVVDIITEARYGNGEPFGSIPAVIYRETEEGEQAIEVTVSGYVQAERDPFGTGDSPTSYEVTIKSVVDAAGNEYSEDEFSDQQMEEIEDLAIDQVR